MTINFDRSVQNFYFLTARENAELDEVATCLYAKHGQFHYGKISFEQFSRKYSPEGWEKRKITALPLALNCALIMTVYHLAKAVFIGIPKACSGNTNYLLSDLFSIGRDLQEAFGRLAIFV